MATKADIARHLDLAVDQLNELLDEGKLPVPSAVNEWDFGSCRVTYIRMLRTMAHGSGDRIVIENDDGDSGQFIDIGVERARLVKAQADSQEQKNKAARSEVVRIEALGATLDRASQQAVAILDAIPQKMVRSNPDLTSEDLDCIKKEVVRARNKIANMDVSLEDICAELADAG